jgi:hypothetical protein
VNDDNKIKILFSQDSNEYDIFFSDFSKKNIFYEFINLMIQKNHSLSYFPLSYQMIEKTSNLIIKQNENIFKAQISNLNFEKLKLFVLTYNMNCKENTPENLKKLIPNKGYDIFVISIQEAIKNIPTIFQEILGEEYVLISSSALGHMRLKIYLKLEKLTNISNIQEFIKSTGFFSKIGNKGGITVTFKYNESSLCFISNYTSFSQNNPTDIIENFNLGNKSLDYNQYDFIFWLGDFGFKLDVNNDDAINLINQKKIKNLLEYDQLKINQGKGRHKFKKRINFHRFQRG